MSSLENIENELRQIKRILLGILGCAVAGLLMVLPGLMSWVLSAAFSLAALAIVLFIVYAAWLTVRDSWHDLRTRKNPTV